MFIWKFLEIENWQEIHAELYNFLDPLVYYDKNLENDRVLIHYLITDSVSTRKHGTIDIEKFSQACPQFMNFLNSHDKSRKVLKVFVTPPNKVQNIPPDRFYPHVDNANYICQTEVELPQTTRQCLSLNLPIKNCADTYTTFYEINESNQDCLKLVLPDGYRAFRCDDLKEISRYNLTQPVICNTSIPHTINNSSTHQWRVSLAIRYDVDPWYLTR